MAQLKNISLLTGFSETDKEKMEHAAIEHKRHNNLSFKIAEINSNSVIIKVIQGKNAVENYFDKKRLIEIVHETFDRFFAGLKIHVHAYPYAIPGPNGVDAAWIVNKMNQMDIRLKHIHEDTGIDYSWLSTLINGHEPLSQSMKAMFYYYFMSKGLFLKLSKNTKDQSN